MSFLTPKVKPAPEEVIETPTGLRRVLHLPRRPTVDCEREPGTRRWTPEAQALVELVTETYSLGPRKCACASLGHPCIKELNPVQAWALREAKRVDGVVGLMPVGSGKTIASLLAPLAISDCRSAVLLIKPDQRLHYKLAYRRLREHFRVPQMVFEDESFRVRGAPILHVVPYSKLSRPESTDMLEKREPDLIIADECHKLTGESSTSIRFYRYLLQQSEADRDVRLCAWSGTLIKKSVKDAFRLSGYALGAGSPLPISEDEAIAWAAVLDVSPTPDRKSSTAKALAKHFGGERKNAFDMKATKRMREGFQSRFLETPGVVSAKSASSGASIYFHELPTTPMPEVVREALTKVRTKWVRPDGEELVEVLDRVMCARAVASGFYYRWVFPRGETRALIDEWLAKRKSYNKELRAKILQGGAHLDSEMLCSNAAARALLRGDLMNGSTCCADCGGHWPCSHKTHLPAWAARAWPAWAEIKDSVVPDPRSKWIDDYFALDCAKWARENRGVVWYLSEPFGRRVAELAKLPLNCGGPEAEARILSEKGDRSVIASIDAHGESRDGLQWKFSKQLVAELPVSSNRWEQLLGRLAREGQKEDEIETWVPLHVPENREALQKAIEYAEFNTDVTSSKQLLLSANMGFKI